MICINCVIGQTSSNLLKVDATTFQISTYISFLTINEISIFDSLTPKCPGLFKCVLTRKKEHWLVVISNEANFFFQNLIV